MSNRKPRFVYLIGTKSENPLYKVGISYNVKRRLKELQTACPFPLEIITAIRAFDPNSVEREIHKRLLPFRIVGEWFDVPLDEILKIVESYQENDMFLRWRYLLGTLGVVCNVISNNSVYLPKEKAKIVFVDFEPDQVQKVDFGNESSVSGKGIVVVQSLPIIYTQISGGYSSSIFLRVFAGSLFDVYECPICDMDFSFYSDRKIHPIYGRYRYIPRASIYIQDGRFMISDNPSVITKKMFGLCHMAKTESADIIKSALK